MPALDGLRAVSILLVVVSHLGLDRVVPGAFGVTLFFFISGYLITRQLLGALGRDGRIGLPNFYLRRTLRLMPAGLAYVAVSASLFVAAGGWIGVGGFATAIFYGANYYDLWHGYRSTLPGVRHPFNILWSLAIEEHFYALWPLLLAWAWRWRHAALAIACVCAAVLLWRLYLFDACFTGGVHAGGVCGPANPNPLWRYSRLYLGTDTRLDSLAWGALLALSRQAPARPAAGGVLIVASFLLAGPLGRHVLRPSVQGLGLLFLFPALLRPGPMHDVLCARPAIWLGRLSYSLYLWHWGALGVADYLYPRHGLRWLLVAALLSATLALASYVGIEQPMLRLRRRAGSHAPLTITDAVRGERHDIP